VLQPSGMQNNLLTAFPHRTASSDLVHNFRVARYPPAIGRQVFTKSVDRQPLVEVLEASSRRFTLSEVLYKHDVTI